VGVVRIRKLRLGNFYWRRLSNGDVGIVTILHERMHQIDRLRDDFK